jgi:hypothetical protein
MAARRCLRSGNGAAAGAFSNGKSEGGQIKGRKQRGENDLGQDDFIQNPYSPTGSKDRL